MKARRGVTRRQFLQISATVAGGLMIGVPAFTQRSHANPKSGQLGFFVRIDPDNTVTLGSPNPEMGQGVRTSLPMLIAEELEVDWQQVKVEQMSLGITRNPDGEGYTWQHVPQGAGGSNSVVTTWEPLRKAGARARELLLMAAAMTWDVPVDECHAEMGYLIHARTQRKLSYGEVAGLAATLPQPETEPKLKDPKDFKIIGQPTPVVDRQDIVTGRAVYGIDAKIPGMKYAVVARCPYFDGAIESIDDTQARAVDGVSDVVIVDGPQPGEPYTALATGVAVVADSTWAAMKGRDALKVDWQRGPFEQETTQGLESACDNALRRGNGQVVHDDGDFATALEGAERMLERKYRVPYVAHATMEPQNCIADVRQDRCDIIGPIQMPSGASRMAAQLTGLDRLAINVHMTRLGGGFGRRLSVDYVAEAVMISKAVQAPVKVQWTREDDLQHDFYRPGGHHQLVAGLGERGIPVAWAHRLASPSKYYRRADRPASEYWRSELFPDDFPARLIPNYRLEYFSMTSGLARGSWRAPAHTANAFAVQSFIDELAHRLDEDPLLYRLRLIGKPQDIEYRNHGGPSYNTGRLAKVLKLAAKKSGWGEELPDGRGRGVAVHYTFGSYVAHVVDVSVSNSGELDVLKVVGAIDCGIPVNPLGVIAQMEGGINDALSTALGEEITIEGGRVVQSNFHDYRMMRIDQAPDIEVHIVESDLPPSGVGEPPVPPLAPALTNAIFAAVGVRIRDLPIGEQLVAAMKERA